VAVKEDSMAGASMSHGNGAKQSYPHLEGGGLPLEVECALQRKLKGTLIHKGKCKKAFNEI
jgi:hypothetical protein